MKYPIVSFDWIDSSTAHGWNDLEEADLGTGMSCHSAGFLIDENEEAYMLADAIADVSARASIGDHPFHCPHAVPKVAVKNFKVLVEADS